MDREARIVSGLDPRPDDVSGRETSTNLYCHGSEMGSWSDFRGDRRLLCFRSLCRTYGYRIIMIDMLG